MRHHLFAAGLIITLSISGVFAGAQNAEASGARVLVTDVVDSRSSKDFFAKCELELLIMGNDVAGSLGIRSVRVDYAADDTGRLLNKKNPHSTGFFNFNEKKDHKMTTKIALKNPAREARFIESIKGEIELFQPNPKNGSQVTIKRFLESPGKHYSHPALEKSKVQVSYVTKEFYEAQKKREMENAKNKQMEQVGQEFGEAFSKLFEGMFAGFMGDAKNSIHLIVNDPKNRIVDFAFIDSDGNLVKPMSRSNMRTLRTYGFQELPAPDLQLVIYLDTPDSVKKVPFSLDKVALP
jgi:hypothetical protein